MKATAGADENLEPTTTPPPSPTATPSPTAGPNVTPEPTPTPAPTRPIAGFGYLDWVEDNGEAEWTNLTAYGPRVDSVAHAYMYDVNGEIVYDNIVEYNGKGYRGPEASYEKPDDVYRILIIGDSFVEAIQVPYEETFQAQLQARLSEQDTAERRYEVVAMGRTGWGTVHETVYYQVEGYKYDADLVILMFYINDVADNFPRFFYPNVNDTNFDFVFGEDGIQILDTNEEPLPPNRPRLLYNALPTFLKESKLARLLIRLADPPVPVQTPGGVMTRVHPQFYIYVAEPPVEGYEEGWQRTADTLNILADSVEANGSELAVMPIFLGQEMVTNVSNWFPELTAGWQWDAGLPEQRLREILGGRDVLLWSTRPYFEEYAEEAGGEVYNLFYLPEDGHFNAQGHEVTYEAVYGWLVEAGLVIE
jgi:lysophospholipase L1-like esterase